MHVFVVVIVVAAAAAALPHQNALQCISRLNVCFPPLSLSLSKHMHARSISLSFFQFFSLAHFTFAQFSGPNQIVLFFVGALILGKQYQSLENVFSLFNGASIHK